MTDLFSSGPRLIEPSGDPRRQAVDSLRGYAYQLYVSALAWLRLQAEEKLYLEVAEDYAIAGGEALQGVQVKDTSGSGRLTINSEDVRQALASFVDLLGRNPRAKVTLRFLSTSEIGIERSADDRVAGEPVLAYWRKAAVSADVAPLRAAILRADVSAEVRTFITARDDETLRRELLQRVFWDCGAAPLDGVKEELSDALVLYGSDCLRLTPREMEGVTAVVVSEVLNASLRTDPSARWLDAAALLRVCEDRTRTSVPKSVVEDLLRQLLPGAGSGSIPVEIRTVLESVGAVPMPVDVLPRQEAVREVVALFATFPLAFLTAGTGMGKSVVARLAARSRPGEWKVLDLRDLSDDECEARLITAIGESASMPLTGVIVEDVNQLEGSRRVASAFGRLVDALHRRDVLCLATCYRQVAAGVLDSLGCGDAASYVVPAFNEAEVARLVQNYGGEPSAWTQAVFVRGGSGHPQLVRAALGGLRRRGWPANELAEFSASDSVVDDIESERESVRRRLVEALDEAPRSLLYRTSLLLGRVRRQLAVALGGIAPEIKAPGEALDILVGPWIDVAGRDLLRVSPLVANTGASMLGRVEQVSVHRTAAEFLFSDGKLHVATGNELFVHALRGEAHGILLQLALAVVTESDDKHAALSRWLPSLRLAATDAPISSGQSAVCIPLRLAQFLMTAAVRDVRAAHVWRALSDELASASGAGQARRFETIALGKALLASNLPSVLPDWFQLLRRLRALFKEDSELAGLAARAEESAPLFEGSRGTPVGVFFIFNAAHIERVSEQLSLFSALDRLAPEERDEYLAFTLSTRGGLTSAVNAPWLAEVKSGTINGRQAANEYLQMSAIAKGWGRLALAIAFAVASSVMLDEYANDAQGALEALHAAEAEFGSHFDLARARAKIHFRQRRHSEMLAIVDELSAEYGSFDALERTFLFREAAIGAAEAGEWGVAAGWFGRAYEDAKTVPGEHRLVLATGLRADMALALYKSGSLRRAIEEYAEVLSTLPTFDNASDLQSVYLSRVVRHGVLWLFLQATGEDASSLVGEEYTTLVPGMCSNQTPPEQIREKALASIDATWYLFAPVECQIGPAAEALARMRVRINGRQIPGFELFIRERCLEFSIRSLSATDFSSMLVRWLDCLVHLETNRDEMFRENVERAQYGEVPAASAEQLSSSFVVESIQHAVLAFGVVAAVSGQMHRVSEVRERLAGNAAIEEAARLLDVMLGSVVVTGATELPDFAATQVRRITAQSTQAPEVLFDATFRFVQVALRSRFARAVAEPVDQWARQRWAVQLQSRFAFRAPNVAIPAIQTALERPGLPGVAAAILAAEPFLSLRLAPALRVFLAQASGQLLSGKSEGNASGGIVGV